MTDISVQKINGTFYTSDTPDILIKTLEEIRLTSERVSITYGNIQTGLVWDQAPAVGTIGRSAEGIPLLIKSIRSIGGEAILSNSILKITGKAGKVLYRGPIH